MDGTVCGSGWTAKAVRQVIEEMFSFKYKSSSVRKILNLIGWSYQRGRKLYINRTEADQARYEFESEEVLEKYSQSKERVTPITADQTKVYLEGTVSRRWNPRGEQPLIADGARSKQSESIYGGVHLGTGEEVAPFAIDWQDSDATICWYEMLLEEIPTGKILIFQDQAPHHTSEEVEEFLEEQKRIEIINFPCIHAGRESERENVESDERRGESS